MSAVEYNRDSSYSEGCVGDFHRKLVREIEDV